ncbi:type III pantothenate kinase [Methylobacter sp.]|uniref:type III pantothenate kinase n=1 Tax=Methylobacter sp. TaxID=2051955 RepID=UPI002FDE4E43
MNLLIDMGNTRLKWAVTTAGQIMTGSPLVNRRIDRDELVRLWKDIYRPRRIAISCVSANRLLELVQSVAHELWFDVDIILVKSQAQAFGVINAYQQPEKMGVDRWLSLVAAWQKYQGSACIVDCGTAITVDLIDADGKHQGGLISPGLTLMKESLGQGTEALSFNTSNHVVGLANFTEAAIYSGTLMAAIGLIEHVLAKQAENTQLILTGGDAELIAGQLDIRSIVDPNLVLRGLLCVLEGHV